LSLRSNRWAEISERLRRITRSDQNFQPREVLTPRSFLSALTGGLLSKFS
jgi:hypothetical protein